MEKFSRGTRTGELKNSDFKNARKIVKNSQIIYHFNED